MIEVPDIQGLGVAFGDISHLPAWDDIPNEFKNGKTQWNKMQSDWFFNGIRASHITPKDGVDKNKALRALAAIQGSFEPKHEHKEAGVAYLASLWFEKYEPANE